MSKSLTDLVISISNKRKNITNAHNNLAAKLVKISTLKKQSSKNKNILLTKTRK